MMIRDVTDCWYTRRNVTKWARLDGLFTKRFKLLKIIKVPSLFIPKLQSCTSIIYISTPISYFC